MDRGLRLTERIINVDNCLSEGKEDRKHIFDKEEGRQDSFYN